MIGLHTWPRQPLLMSTSEIHPELPLTSTSFALGQEVPSSHSLLSQRRRRRATGMVEPLSKKRVRVCDTARAVAWNSARLKTRAFIQRGSKPFLKPTVGFIG